MPSDRDPREAVKVDTLAAVASPTEAVTLAREARAIGFDGMFTAETNHDPFLPIAAAATTTPDLEYGTAVAVAFARSPMVTAMAAWDLAAATHGRFILGLGTQIKAHITRRFSMDWDRPGPRLREYVEAIRAIWGRWQDGTPLRFRGEFYQHTLTAPFFEPAPLPHRPPPIYIAGVGPYMAGVAGEVSDGLHVHPFHTVRYLDEVIAPGIAAGARRRDRDPGAVALAASVMVATGTTPEEIETNRRAVAKQIAFYASTPAYKRVLDLHAWNVGPELTRLSIRGEWDAMGRIIPEEMIDAIAVSAPVEELAEAIRARYGERLARVGLYALDRPLPIRREQWPEVIRGLKGRP
jgi:probable F420-dependent oxidoreductase